ncbi:hypothetical protein STIAU_6413 [Stigmatella aurantiaca DW4/3-1]|uniref:Outer membrane protein beta-barrel domain-containing protein n=1 Tax=Stigmatella aurantiaca (strain DW4/3-1) TaxID=378806 RepID=Q08QP8_STIAD|nr:hypothetical protein STIAU_6413 [Stigmatella aurantiaca DW4/3-1]
MEPAPHGAPWVYRVTPLPGAETVSVAVRRHKAQAQAQVQVGQPPPPPEPPPTPPEPLPLPPPEPPPAPSRVRRGVALHLLAGAFFAEGSNQGPLVALGLSYPLPFWGQRLSLEAEAGVRRIALTVTLENQGELRSRVLAAPVLASARLTLLEGGAFALHGRVGGGLLPFQHDVSSNFQSGFQEGKLSAMAFVSAQAAYRFGHWSALLEPRWEHGPVRTPRLDAKLGGIAFTLGVRYEP